ncbi:hypothetical protein NQ314_011407 [Rhamnusium bicolor]|uniref:CUB domain-containing protein n=1 Tax=Rhamnusium bicolor TaxID=1586634 RepID=A0AAV8XJB7_9CUCU|nr:hypothetical protein NQ314_011407 [Rhamnusium bicolor]
MSWTYEQVDLLIEQVEKNKCLYDLKDPAYHKKHMRNIALEEIKEALIAIRPKTTIEDILKKWKGLRSTYCAEKKKYISLIKGAGSIEEIRPSNLWYYKKMMFLDDHITPNQCVNKIGLETQPTGMPIIKMELNDSEYFGEEDINQILDPLEDLYDRNRVRLKGYPTTGNMNNVSQFISSPFFPYLYPIDLSVEYVINCESLDPCRISLLFTDFLLAGSSIIEFFDWNGQRMYVTSGNIFRPPVIISTGPSLIIRFYANGVSSYGFKAAYSFVLGNLDDLTFKPNIGCGGNVNNLGGGITMMNMVEEGTKFFDCVWIIKPPENYLHRKTHLYVKVVNFLDFAGTTELVIRQGLTSNQPAVDIVKYPMTHVSLSKHREHIVPKTQGFYISLRGHFGPGSRLALVYAAFNYKDCFAGSDFLCHNLRCISVLLNCDGFDHCGDESDESSDCSLDPKDHREFSEIPNFLFPKMDPYSDIVTATFVFLTCSFGLIGIILAMALLLYRVNIRARHQRQIQDHIETIHAILAPPDYDDVLNLKHLRNISGIKASNKRRLHHSFSKNAVNLSEIWVPAVPSGTTNGDYANSRASTSKCCKTTSINIPDSPPPAYQNIKNYVLEGNKLVNYEISSCLNNTEIPSPGIVAKLSLYQLRNYTIETNAIKDTYTGWPSFISMECVQSEVGVRYKTGNPEQRAMKYFENIPKYPSQMFSEIRKSFRNCKSVNFIKHARKVISFSEENLVRYFSDSELFFYSNVNINFWTKSNTSKFKKSFSTDDISSL